MSFFPALGLIIGTITRLPKEAPLGVGIGAGVGLGVNGLIYSYYSIIIL